MILHNMIWYLKNKLNKIKKKLQSIVRSVAKYQSIAISIAKYTSIAILCNTIGFTPSQNRTIRQI